MNIRSGSRLKVLLLAASILFLQGCSGARPAPVASGRNVGFDIDDTLLFSSPAFERGAKSGAEDYSKEYWAVVNSSDREHSKVKKKAKAVLLGHTAAGDGVYAITARDDAGGEALKKFISDEFGIPQQNVFFEPEDKVKRMRLLKLAIYYGDSDSDIEAAVEAGAKPVRILRAKESSYRRKYHPGKFGEEIIEDSEW